MAPILIVYNLEKLYEVWSDARGFTVGTIVI